MTAYVDEYISRESTISGDAGIRAEAADDGTILFRKDQPGTNYALTIIHEWVTQAWYDELIEWIETNDYGPHTLTLKGIDFEMTLVNDPEIVQHKGHLYTVHVKALAVRAEAEILT
jgi:hypothetical protein